MYVKINLREKFLHQYVVIIILYSKINYIYTTDIVRIRSRTPENGPTCHVENCLRFEVLQYQIIFTWNTTADGFMQMQDSIGMSSRKFASTTDFIVVDVWRTLINLIICVELCRKWLNSNLVLELINKFFNSQQVRGVDVSTYDKYLLGIKNLVTRGSECAICLGGVQEVAHPPPPF